MHQEILFHDITKDSRDDWMLHPPGTHDTIRYHRCAATCVRDGSSTNIVHARATLPLTRAIVNRATALQVSRGEHSYIENQFRGRWIYPSTN